MTGLSDLFGIIMDRGINAPSNEKNVVYGINDTEKQYSKEKWKFLEI